MWCFHSNFMFLWPCIVNNVWRERKPTRCNYQMYIINFYLNMFRASLRPSSVEQRPCVTAHGVLCWFCWMWLVAVVGRCVVGCEQCEGYCSTVLCCRVRAVWRLLFDCAVLWGVSSVKVTVQLCCVEGASSVKVTVQTVTFTVLSPYNTAQSNSNLHTAHTPQRSTVEQ